MKEKIMAKLQKQILDAECPDEAVMAVNALACYIDALTNAANANIPLGPDEKK